MERGKVKLADIMFLCLDEADRCALHIYMHIYIHICIGGENIRDQLRAVENGADIIAAAPGRSGCRF
jgi:superfamily II DNA/RNA helicase